MRILSFLFASLAAIAIAPAAHASETRHWIVRAGIHPIAPKPHNHPVLTVDDSVAFSLGATYLFTEHWALELFGAAPVKHELSIDRDRVGTFDMVPATLTVQYHITDTQQRIRAYVGLGAAYADLTHERSDGAFTNRRLELTHSTGLAAAAGLDMNMGRRWFVNIDARWFDIDTDVKLDAADMGRLRIDPYAFGLSIGRRLR